MSTSPHPGPWMRVRRHPWLLAGAVLLIAIVVLVAVWDWNWFKGPVERQVQSRTGRVFHIEGNLDVDLGRVTTIRLDELTFGNAPCSNPPTWARADRLDFDIKLWPLLHRQFQIPRIRLERPMLLLEKGPKGVGNWVFGSQQPSRLTR